MLPELLSPLVTIARNLWWTWQPDAVDLFRDVDPHRWEKNHRNPLALLAEVEAERWAELAADPTFVARMRHVATGLAQYLAAPTWYGANVPKPQRVAYFSMEFGLAAYLKTYSGGLGVLAGDHLKSASDLGVPLVGITLFYHQGYFRQVIDDGVQLAAYPTVRMERLPYTLCLGADGKPIELSVRIAEHEARFRIWEVPVGRTRLLFLDADIDGNSHAVRNLSRSLYGGDEHTRIGQEILLGIGGVKALRALNLPVDVYHMNEGHCAFVPLELMREETVRGSSFAKAVQAVRARCVFTTHTPVPAGHDRFTPALVRGTLGPWVESIGWKTDDVLDLGRVKAGDANESLCMTVIALKTSNATNGVSARHGEVSREMWAELWPDRPAADAPIGHVTNGVHPMYWMAAESQVFFDAYVPGWRDAPWDPAVWAAGLSTAPVEAIWRTRGQNRAKLCAFLRHRHGAELDPSALTIGFARRFATYKRGDLLFSDPDRLAAILNGPRPVQILYAGKAHPRDKAGQEVLARVLRWADDPRFRGRVFFVEDYDMDVGAALTSGVDVWLNNPRRPLEASGTSGQKVVLNLGLNLSVLDGWWIEGYDGRTGWAIGGLEVEDDAAMDASDAERLYEVLEQQVLPDWSERDEAGVPGRWIERVIASTVVCASAFNSHRMVRDYVQQLYRVSPEPRPRVAAP